MVEVRRDPGHDPSKDYGKQQVLPVAESPVEAETETLSRDVHFGSTLMTRTSVRVAATGEVLGVKYSLKS